MVSTEEEGKNFYVQHLEIYIPFTSGDILSIDWHFYVALETFYSVKCEFW